MRKDSRELDVLALSKLPRKTFHVAGSDAQPVHAGIDLQMKLYALLSPAARRRAIEQRQLFAAMDHRRQVVLHQPGFLSRHETGKNQNWLSNTGLADGDAFVRARDAKPVRPGLLQRLRHFRAAVAVTIAFDDRENLARRFAFFLRRVYVLANRFQIVCQRAKRNFRPDRTSRFVAGTLLCACHVPSEKFSLRHSPGLGPPPATLVAA